MENPYKVTNVRINWRGQKKKKKRKRKKVWHLGICALVTLRIAMSRKGFVGGNFKVSSVQLAA